MWPLSLLFLSLNSCVSAADPSVSPSIEADAEYLLTTTDFMDAQFGMAVEATDVTADAITIRTTGAQFAFLLAEDRLTVSQRLGREREAVRVTFAEGALSGLQVERSGSGAVLLRTFGGTLQLRVNADSLLMLRCQEPLELQYDVAFEPASVRRFRGDRLMLDEWGCVGSYCATGESKATDRVPERTVEYSLDAGQVWWLSVGPPRPYPWEDSFTERVAWHWSTENAYPADSSIEQWSKYANIVLQQAEVMMWKDWSLRFIPRNGIEEFQRVNRTCERLGMRNIVYTSPFYFLTGTGLEPRAMNSFDNFAETGFSPGDSRGLNWPIFLSEITKVMRDYKPDGLYFDGIYGNVVRTYLISRRAREVVGDQGILEFHATGSPPGRGVYLPQIDTYFTFILRGEGRQAQYTDPEYLRYFVSTYNISNSIGVLCNNNSYSLDQEFVDTLLDNNIRLHYLPGGADDQRLAGMEQFYWPALTPALQERVAKKAEARQAASVAARRELLEAMTTPMPDVPIAWQESFDDPALAMKLPDPVPQGGAEAPLPGGWSGYLSPRSKGTITASGGLFEVSARANTVAFIERDLPADTVAVQCRLRAGGEFGQSWGPGLALWIGDTRARIGLRTDDHLQTDIAGEQTLYSGYPADQWYWLRLRIAGVYLLAEVSRDGDNWTFLHVNRLATPGAPKRLMLGKVPYDASRTEYTDPGGRGICLLDDVKVYAPAADPP